MKIFNTFGQLAAAKVLTGTPVRVLEPALIDGVVEATGEGLSLLSGNVFVPSFGDQESITARKTSLLDDAFTGGISAYINTYKKDNSGNWLASAGGRTSAVFYAGQVWWPLVEIPYTPSGYLITSWCLPTGNPDILEVTTSIGTVFQFNRFTGLIDGGNSGGSTVSDTPPINPLAGNRWTRCSDMKSFIWYVGDDGSQWVEDNPSMGGDANLLVLADGSTAPRRLGERFADVVNVKDFGAKGDGLSNDYQYIQDALDAHGSIKLTSGVYALGGGTLTAGSNTHIYTEGDVTLQNGTLTIQQINGANVYVDDITFDACVFIVGGGLFQHMHGVKLGRLRFLNSVFGPRYITNFVFDDIDITWGDDNGVPRNATGNLTCLYHGTIGRIKIEGYYGMGFQTAGNGSQNVYNTYNVKIGQLISLRNPSSASETGWHGFYLLGNRKLVVDTVFSTGYPTTQGVSNAFKLRDSWECTFTAITCDSAQLASDANTGLPLRSLRDNIIERLDLKYGDDTSDNGLGIGSVSITGNGVIHNNEVRWFRGGLTTSGVINIDGGRSAFIFTNHVELTTGSVQNTGLVFKNATITSASPDTSYIFNRHLDMDNCEVFFDIVTSNAGHSLRNCYVHGSVFGRSTASTFTSAISNTTIDGSLECNTFGARTWNAEWVHIDVKAAYPVGTALPNGDIRFRNASFNNRLYHTSEVDFIDIV